MPRGSSPRAARATWCASSGPAVAGYHRGQRPNAVGGPDAVRWKSRLSWTGGRTIAMDQMKPPALVAGASTDIGFLAAQQCAENLPPPGSARSIRTASTHALWARMSSGDRGVRHGVHHVGGVLAAPTITVVGDAHVHPCRASRTATARERGRTRTGVAHNATERLLQAQSGWDECSAPGCVVHDAQPVERGRDGPLSESVTGGDLAVQKAEPTGGEDAPRSAMGSEEVVQPCVQG